MDRRTAVFLGIGLLVTLIVAGVVSGFASSDPDGLERVSMDQGFDDRAEDHVLADGPLADYSVDGVADERIGTGLAGILGAVITLIAVVALLYGTRAFAKRRGVPE